MFVICIRSRVHIQKPIATMDVSNLSRLKHPPIVEAVVDFDCDMPVNFDLASLQETLAGALSSTYPQKQLIHQVGFKFQVNPTNPSSTAEQALDALRFRNEEGNQIVQYRRTGFSFNRISPYTSFDDHLLEIKERWMQFVELAKPVVLRTLRLRYINSLNIPIVSGEVDIVRYLNGAAVLQGNGIASGEYLLQLNVTDESKLLEGVVVSNLQASSGSHVPVVIDIAVQRGLDCELDDMRTIVESLNSLREFKNKIFASMITEECWRMLKEST